MSNSATSRANGQSPKGWLMRVLSVSFAILLLWFVNQSYIRLQDTLEERRQLHSMRMMIDRVMDDLISAESSQRTFLLSEDPRYLASYRNAVTRVTSNIDSLSENTLAGRLEADAISHFVWLGSDIIERMADELELHQEDNLDPFEYSSIAQNNWLHISQLQQQRDALLSHADQLIANTDAKFGRRMNRSRIAFLISVLMAALAFALYVSQQRRIRAADTLRREWLGVECNMLEAKVRQRTEALSELATYLQRAVEGERAALARELHDELGALMTAAKLDVSRLKSRIGECRTDLIERLEHLNLMLNEAVKLKRRVIESLRPSALDNLGLVAALEILTKDFGRNSGLLVNTSLGDVHLDGDGELTIYRLVQEALTNITKHAHAKTVTVKLTDDEHYARISVVDDGIGFNPKDAAMSAHGLLGMRHRVQASGGELSIRTGVGLGVFIEAELPQGGDAKGSIQAEPM